MQTFGFLKDNDGSNNNNVELSIIMPCLNESRTIGICILKAKNILKKNSIVGEIIVADNGSTDGANEIAAQEGAIVINVDKKGYGSSIKRGIKSASGKYIIIGDADNTYNFNEIYPFVEKLRDGNDLVVGNRFPCGGGNIMHGSMPWLHRKLGTPLLNFIGKSFFNSPIYDFHCGLRGLTRESFSNIKLYSEGMEFASEMIITACLKKMKISEIPVTLYKTSFPRKAHLRTFRDGFRHLALMILYKMKYEYLIPIILS